MNEQSHDNYESIGTYTNSDARILLDAYEHAKVRFLVAVDDSQLKGMAPSLRGSDDTDRVRGWPSRY